MAGFRPRFPQVQDALGQAIADALALLPDKVGCSVGYPRGGAAERQVWVDGEVNARHPFHTSGGAVRGEEGRIPVRILVTLTAEDMSEPRDVAVTLAGVVEDVLEDDRTLGALVESAFVIATSATEAILDETTRQYDLTLTVEYKTELALT